MTVKLFGLSNDPDTIKASSLLSQANIGYKLVDVEKSGILASLERDLDVRDLPFILVPNGKVEGIKQIEGFIRHSR